MIGIYGLIFEFMSPGAIAPGVVGTICLLLGLYALNMLPVNYAGFALMLVGIALLAVEAFNPTVVIGVGGLISFVLGALMLFQRRGAGLHAVMVGDRHHHGAVRRLPACRARRAAPRRQRARPGRRAGHARPAGRGARLVRHRGSRLHQWRALAGARHRDVQIRRDGRSRQHHRFDAGGPACAGRHRRGEESA